MEGETKLNIMKAFLLRFALLLTPSAWEWLCCLGTMSIAVLDSDVVVVALVDEKQLAAKTGREVSPDLFQCLLSASSMSSYHSLSETDKASLQSFLYARDDVDDGSRTISYCPVRGLLFD